MTYKKKLIEVGLPLAKINAESIREKSIVHGHPATLHRWWARRPLAAVRAVLFASLVDDPSAHPDLFPTEDDQMAERRRLFGVIERLVPWEATSGDRILDEARIEILRSCGGDLPNVLDPFAGGGAIPLEAARLGLPTFSGDLNPVAVLIQRAMLEIPSRFANRVPVHPMALNSQAFWSGSEGLAADVEHYGRWMLARAIDKIGILYPDATMEDGKRVTPIAWIWARTVESPDPSWPGHVPLVKSWVVSRKPGKPTVWVEPIADYGTKSIRFEIRVGGKPPVGTVDGGNGTCIATGTAIPGQYIKSEANLGKMGQVLIAIAAEGPNGRVYCRAEPQLAPSESPAVDGEITTAALPVGGLGFRVQAYGMKKWVDLFLPRQLTALATFSDLLPEVHNKILEDSNERDLDGAALHAGGSHAQAYADAVVTYLAFVIDKCADYWSGVCSWQSGLEKMRPTFPRQAIAMTWDIAEANPFSSSSGNWNSMLDWVVKAVRRLPATSAATVIQADAAATIRQVGLSVIATDPPYYDNIGYADLSDFFYGWLRRNLLEIWPDDLATLLTPKVDELIADPSRAGSKNQAKTHFEDGMANVYRTAYEYHDSRFPATAFYAFKATETTDDGIASTGWETYLTALLNAGYTITATWPIRTELPSKIGAKKNMLASSIVIALRPRHVDAPLATRGEFIATLRNELPRAIRTLQLENIAPVDMAQSAMGPGIAVYSRYAKVVEADGSAMTVRTALALINDVLAEVLSGEESEFDADTRFALTWFEQFGLNPGPFGDADVLAKAKGTSVGGVEQSGVVVSKGGKVTLVERADLPTEWDPANDTRLAIWEITQHLIRALESSEAEAARILKRIGGGLGERACQLAYLLYEICDRKKWSAEASAYNMLVTAWPELVKLAAGEDGGADPESLF